MNLEFPLIIIRELQIRFIIKLHQIFFMTNDKNCFEEKETDQYYDSKGINLADDLLLNMS